MMTARTIPSKFPKAEEDDDGTHDSVDLSKHDSPHDSVEIRVRPSKKMMTARTTPSTSAAARWGRRSRACCHHLTRP